MRNSSPPAANAAAAPTASAISDASAREFPIDGFPLKSPLSPEVIGIDAPLPRPALIVPPIRIRIAKQPAPRREPRAGRHAPGKNRRIGFPVGPAWESLGFAECIGIAIGVRLAARDQTMLRILEFPVSVDMEMLDKGSGARIGQPIAGQKIDRKLNKLRPCLR